jgi:hypothetical protein
VVFVSGWSRPLCHSGYVVKLEQAHVELLQAREVDGVSYVQGVLDTGVPHRLSRCGLPTIAVDWKIPDVANQRDHGFPSHYVMGHGDVTRERVEAAKAWGPEEV